MPDFSTFLRNSSYKRAIFLVNIPDLIYLEEKVGVAIASKFDHYIQQNYQGKVRYHLVVEDVEMTKKCKVVPHSSLQVPERTHFSYTYTLPFD